MSRSEAGTWEILIRCKEKIIYCKDGQTLVQMLGETVEPPSLDVHETVRHKVLSILNFM